MKAAILTIVMLSGLWQCGLAGDKLIFWSTLHRGANIFNETIPMSTLQAAKDYSIDFLRIAPDKFASKERDFLIGNADEYRGLVQEDLATLTSLLDSCEKVQMPVVLVMLSLPGSRWKQNNGDVDDLRLWQDNQYFAQCAAFWRGLAVELKNHPAIVGYNILNEPHLERLRDSKSRGDIQVRLHEFYETVIAAIREVDSLTPIIVESSSYGDPTTLEQLFPLSDPRVIYSVHMYEPYNYTNKRINDGRFAYPGPVFDNDLDSAVVWDKQRLAAYFAPVVRFQQRHGLSSDRVYVGEFGGNRQSKGIGNYLADLMSIFEENHWHWSVYSFREDTWDGMDYELGDGKLPWKFWQDIEKGIEPEKPYKPDNPIFKVLLRGWAD